MCLFKIEELKKKLEEKKKITRGKNVKILFNYNLQNFKQLIAFFQQTDFYSRLFGAFFAKESLALFIVLNLLLKSNKELNDIL